MNQKCEKLFAQKAGKEVASFCRVAEALKDEDRRAIMVLLTSCSPCSGYGLAGVISETGIEQAEIQLALLIQAGLVKTVKGRKQEVIYQVNWIWRNLLREWLKFRKDECKKLALEAGFYP